MEQHLNPSSVISLNEDQDDTQDEGATEWEIGMKTGIRVTPERKGLPPSLSSLSFPSERLGWLGTGFDC